MTNTKPWYLSKTVWAGLVSATAATAAIFGVPINEAAKNNLVDSGFQLVSAISGIFAVFGRVTASTRISGTV